MPRTRIALNDISLIFSRRSYNYWVILKFSNIQGLNMIVEMKIYFWLYFSNNPSLYFETILIPLIRLFIYVKFGCLFSNSQRWSQWTWKTTSLLFFLLQPLLLSSLHTLHTTPSNNKMSSLESQSESRKARLAQLRNLKNKKDSSNQ